MAEHCPDCLSSHLENANPELEQALERVSQLEETLRVGIVTLRAEIPDAPGNGPTSFRRWRRRLITKLESNL